MDIMKRSQIVALLSTGLAVVGITGCAMLPGNRDERSAGRWYDDHEITKHVEKALDREPTYKFEDVAVRTFAGQVQLSGFVNSNEQKERAAQIASTVPGVEGVHNSLLLKPLAPSPTGRTNGGYHARIYSSPPAPRSQPEQATSSRTQTNQDYQNSQPAEQK